MRIKKMLDEESITRVSTFTRVRVFIAIYTLTLINCLYVVWGNLSAYVISYFHFRVQGGPSLNSAWLSSVNAACWGVGMLMCQRLTRIIGIRAVMVLGNLLFCVSMALCYFSIQHSPMAFIVTHGLIPGIGFGLMHGVSSLYIIIWSDSYVAFATSVLISSELLGGCAMNLLMTWYINPDNLSADSKEIMHTKMFFQDRLLDKIPNVFIIYALMAFGLGVLSFLLVKDKKPNFKNDDTEKLTPSKGVSTTSETSSMHQTTDNTSDKYKPNAAISEKSLIKAENGVSYSLPQNKVNNTVNEKPSDNMLFPSSSEKLLTTENCEDISPSQALKTKAYYVLLTAIAYTDLSLIIFFTYYKTFGMLYISDDHFLTSASMSLTILIALSSNFAGVIAERFDLKNSVVALNSVACIMLSFLYVSALLNDKWFYMIWVLAYGCCLYASYTLSSIYIIKLFGKTHSTTIIGMCLTFSNCTIFVLSPGIHFILNNYGWLTLFTFNSIVNIIGFSVVVFGLPSKTHS